MLVKIEPVPAFDAQKLPVQTRMIAIVEPTNNVVERMLRTAVQWRKISFGTRSRNGEIATGRLLHSDADLQEAAATRIGLPY